jgi:hypothetical protein
MNSNFLLSGFGKKIITPSNVVDIYALDGRKRDSKNLLDDLFVRVVFLKQSNKIIFIISIDIIWVSSEFVEKIKFWICAKYNISDSDILISATHSHSTPQIDNNNLNPARPDEDYVNYLFDQTIAAVCLASSKTDKCHCKYIEVDANLNINRRKKKMDLSKLKKFKIKYKIYNRPNKKGDKDGKISVLWFCSGDKYIGSIVNYACHPSLVRENAVSPDFPGRVSKYLEDMYGDSHISCFLQGFSGDVKANLLQVNNNISVGILRWFYNLLFDRVLFKKRLSVEELDSFSLRLIGFIDPSRASTLNTSLFSCGVEVSVPLDCSTLKESGDNCNELYDPVTIKIQRISIGNNLDIVAINGEVFSHYSTWLRNKLLKYGRKVIPVGCANGMIGYIPDGKAVIEGGYEVERSLCEFNQSSKFSYEIDSIVKAGILSTYSHIDLR